VCPCIDVIAICVTSGGVGQEFHVAAHAGRGQTVPVRVPTPEWGGQPPGEPAGPAQTA